MANAAHSLPPHQLESFTINLACEPPNPLILLRNTLLTAFAPKFRLFSVLFNHLVFRKSQKISSAQHGGSALFEPIITSSFSPLLEIDFNLHKSNATFYTDLDINRIHLLSVLFKSVINPSLKPGPTKDGKLGGLVAALGGVSCTFRREIKPYQKYEIWTRVLCWDDKWLYLVSHFVKADSVRPRSYRLPGSQSASGKRQRPSKGTNSVIQEKQTSSLAGAEVKKMIFASAISKYVFKQGRKTIPVERVLEELDLLPPRPIDNDSAGKVNHTTIQSGQEEPKEKGEATWGWRYVQQENQRGLVFARMFAGLDDLPQEFTADSMAALGYFGEFPWC
jgi:hypothetical protein